jgi:predicted XRE-type DNA-binding protein
MKEIYEQYRDTDYLVSNYGRVKNLKTNLILKTNINRYARVVIYNNGLAKNIAVHRMVAELFLENPENKPQVNHIDGDKLNNHVSNLEWCTQSENQQHAFDTGLQISKKGEEHHNCKLTEADVLEIKELLESGEVSGPEIASLFDVNQQLVSKINKGHRWSHVTGWTPENRSHIVVDYGKYLAKLKAEDIPIIRKKFEEGWSDSLIAKAFHVHQGTINAIRRNKTWKNY